MKILTKNLVVTIVLLMGIGLLSFTIAASAAGTAASNQADQDVFSGNEAGTYDEAAVLLRYARLSGGIREGQQVPSLILFDDGYIRVFYPGYMKQAGIYAIRLNQNDLDRLRQMLADEQLLEMDTARIRSEVAQRKRLDKAVSSEIHGISDTGTVYLEIYSGRLLANVGLYTRDPDEVKTISWQDLQNDATQYPEIAEVRKLHAIFQQLEVIMRRTDLMRIDEAR